MKIAALTAQPSWQCPNVSTTPLRQWGFRQCLPFRWATLRGKHCRHPIAVMGVVNTFGHSSVSVLRPQFLHFVLPWSCSITDLYSNWLSTKMIHSLTFYNLSNLILPILGIHSIKHVQKKADSRSQNNEGYNYKINSRCLMVSTNQADPGCFYYRISWILMKRRWFYFFHPLHFLQGLRSLKHWLLQKLSMKIFDQKFRFFIKK